jgi:murein DD-endopeptidase MepM/ murein hydrolase activator NlpD
MKITLFIKSYTTKACSILILVSLVAGTPTKANAGFFNDLVASVVGSSAQADNNDNVDTTNSTDFGTDDFSNSQNLTVLSTSSIDPDTKNVNNNQDVNIVEGGAISPDVGLVGSGLESVSSGEMMSYEVKEGDTLSEIAMQYDVSVNTIRWENNITGNSIKVGQKLNILPVTGVKHVIKSGDSLDKIAAKYDADVEDIMVFNGITKSDALKSGDILYVPNGIIKPVVVAEKPTTKKGTSSNTPSTSVTAGYYLRPASGPITSPYGSRRGGFHYGVDIGASRGTRVGAAASGTVVETVSSCVEGRTSCGGRYGNYIVIAHANGTFTRYAHLSRVNVEIGEKVSRGEKIGASGNTGHSTGPHLHFQIEKSSGATIRPKF